MLKVRSPEDDESDQEAEALALWAGHGAVRLLREDSARRAMLLERARPGTDISALPEEAATGIGVDVAQRLWRRSGDPFRWIGDWVPRWLDEVDEGATEPVKRLRARSRELYEALQVGRSTLVHGDFHHHNVLDAGDRFVAIDPKPMLGEPEFDVPPFLWNPLGSGLNVLVAEARLEAFAAAGLDQRRMRAWAVIRGGYLGLEGDEAEVLLALERS